MSVFCRFPDENPERKQFASIWHRNHIIDTLTQRYLFPERMTPIAESRQRGEFVGTRDRPPALCESNIRGREGIHNRICPPRSYKPAAALKKHLCYCCWQVCIGTSVSALLTSSLFITNGHHTDFSPVQQKLYCFFSPRFSATGCIVGFRVPRHY